ncbi:VOC family protein [Legionella septentrionalis]|uniref:Glyoxalase/bleomycin resistance/extradiol dioxygenase family protein n=1 Tax=Legionella septentrionalis TaxID=2498109 RepID=A0A433JHS8_9GAMM|nr:VOC family protein [Legionella septentrionalis]RUQ84436.1 glyoxalase/bleomycin resistance/extradiol dioxygenase family protein [Legionella septentrionalis]RUR09239.1 glyoxalase/bleomycin resistance/extradiol dioxygenase family protein [Legionella septentrionalis]
MAIRTANNRQIYINLPVKNLQQTIGFFTQLGFAFNPQFTDENATCMIISDSSFVMLLQENFFKSFIPAHELANADKSKEVLVALSLESRAAVDDMIDKAIAAGGKEYRPMQDQGWMYGRAFQDINGHVWEPFFIDISAMPEEMKSV